jgi:hypothetical protein
MAVAAAFPAEHALSQQASAMLRDVLQALVSALHSEGDRSVAASCFEALGELFGDVPPGDSIQISPELGEAMCRARLVPSAHVPQAQPC